MSVPVIDLTSRQFPHMSALAKEQDKTAWQIWLKRWAEVETHEEAIDHLDVALEGARGSDLEAASWIMAAANWYVLDDNTHREACGKHHIGSWCSHRQFSEKAMEVGINTILRADSWMKLLVRDPTFLPNLLTFLRVCKRSQDDGSPEKKAVTAKAVKDCLRSLADPLKRHGDRRPRPDPFTREHWKQFLEVLLIWELQELIVWADEATLQALYELTVRDDPRDGLEADIDSALTTSVYYGIGYHSYQPAERWVILSRVAKARRACEVREEQKHPVK